jgi:hypothetical protein
MFSHINLQMIGNLNEDSVNRLESSIKALVIQDASQLNDSDSNLLA